MQANLPPPAAVIIGEPTSMAIASAHKGCYVQRTRVRGKEAHSSQPQLGGSAILAAGDVLRDSDLKFLHVGALPAASGTEGDRAGERWAVDVCACFRAR